MGGPWRFFTDDEVDYILAHPDDSDVAIGETLGRNRESVKKKRRQLAEGWSPQREPWTAEEDALILATPHMTAKQVARQIGRTVEAVQCRRKVMVSLKGVNFGGSNKSPFQPGARPLLCKTCPHCGLLLQALWFHQDRFTRTWSARCSRCRGKGRPRNPAPKQAEYSRNSVAKLQAITKEHASRHAQPWMEADHEVLSDPDLTITEKALALGRTYQSANHACSANGYKSHVGKGDPERDQWIIRNPQQHDERKVS